MLIGDSDPYPWPYDADLLPSRVALILTGVQRCHLETALDPEGTLAVIDSLVAAVRSSGGCSAAIRHGRIGVTRASSNSSSNPSAKGRERRICAASLPLTGSSPWQIDDRISPTDVVIDAYGYDGFYGGPLDAWLRGERRDQLVFAGFCGEIGLDSTLRSGNDRGYECLVVRDAVSHLSTFTGHHVLSSVTKSGGIFGALAQSASLVAALRALPSEGSS